MIDHFRNRRRRYARIIARAFVLFWIATAVAPCVHAAAWSGTTAAPCQNMPGDGATADCEGCCSAARLNCEAADSALRVTPDTPLDLPPPPLHRWRHVAAALKAPGPPPHPAAATTGDFSTPLLSRPHILRT